MTMDENEAYTPKNVARFVHEHMKASTASSADGEGVLIAICSTVAPLLALTPEATKKIVDGVLHWDADDMTKGVYVMRILTAYELGKLFLPSVPVLPSEARKELDELVQAFEDQAKRSE